jgi:dihydrofolate synthase/folylpolyglutamate synthase
MTTLSSYEEALDCLFDMNRRTGVKLGLESMQDLCAALGHPERRFPSILIGGSNGKGTLAWQLAQALSAGAYRVGMFSSPHIATFRERIQVSQSLISKEAVCRHLAKILAAAEAHNLHPTFFELCTALAFLEFAEQEVDIAVLEVGLGGRLDATNVVDPLLSVVCSISLEHCHILGDTIEQIAQEKAGIMRAKTPLVVGPDTPVELFRQWAEEKGSPFFLAEESEALFDTVYGALSARFPLNEHALEIARASRPPCRFEQLEFKGLDVIMDVAHNPAATERLAHRVGKVFPERAIVVLLGMAEDKDLSGAIAPLAKIASHIHCVPINSPRAADVDRLRGHCVPYCDSSGHESLVEGVQAAISWARDEGAILLVCGSFCLMAELRAQIGIREARDPVNLNESSLKLA